MVRYLTIIVYVLFSGQEIFAQLDRTNSPTERYAGAPSGIISTQQPSNQLSTNFITVNNVSNSLYTTTVFTFKDVTIFSYFDSTKVMIIGAAGDTVGNVTLKADTLYSINPGQGIYSISGNKPYSVLIGDAITNYVNGFFALDQSGRGLSTKLNTWMMTGSSKYDPHFIVFAYEDGTQYTIRELSTGNFVYASTLNKGQFLDFPNISTIQGKAIQVVSNKPVSALSYTDQDYYVPSANGFFSGKLFYGFSGYSGYWQNSITVTSYADNNIVLITNLATGDTIAVDTLGLWQVKAHGIKSDTFWKVVSTGTVTAANIPFAGWKGNYNYMARSADSTGKNIGTTFVIPTIKSKVSIFSYENNNRVKVIKLGNTTYPYLSPTLIADTVLQVGKGFIFQSPYGNYVYRIKSQKNVSVVQSSGGWGADFMPLGYSLDLPDLAISQSDIVFNPPDSVYISGEQITIAATVHNYGTLDKGSIQVVMYDGDPDAGVAPSIGSFIAPSIPVEGSYTGYVKYMIPVNAQYHTIYIKVDPQNLISESNESNNKSFRPLIPNRDLLPPLSVYVTAPGALKLVNSVLTPNPFEVKADIFNTGTISASNVRVQLFVYNGIKVDSGSVDTTIGTLTKNNLLTMHWKIRASRDSSGLNLYTIRVEAGNAPAKEINRGIIVPDIIPPAAPTRLVVNPTDKDGTVILVWAKNPEQDLAGYKIYYSSETNGFGGTEAKEGTSPITVTTIDTFTVSGLVVGKTYRFAVSAFDLSTNESLKSNVVSLVLTGILKSNNAKVPKLFSLFQNYPNPFNPVTNIRYDLPVRSFVKLEVYNILGEKVAVLISSEQSAGTYELGFDGSKLSSGIYFYRLTTGTFTSMMKMILMK